jgi:predicted MFS family arabinose efflux permease
MRAADCNYLANPFRELISKFNRNWGNAIMAELNMVGGPIMDVNELIDGQAVQRSSIVFLIVATLAMIGDGFDLAVIGYVVPELVKQWGIAPKAFTVALTAGVIGLFVGGPLLGYFGDRLGRKKAIIIGLCVYGLLTLATMIKRQFIAGN